MPSWNSVQLMGHLTRDVQLKTLPSGMAVGEFGIAINRKFKTASGEEREEVTFVDITAFGKTAEVMNQYLLKGKPIFIDGRLKLDQWEDKNGGGKRSKLSVVCESFQFIGGRDSDHTGGDEDQTKQERRPPAARPPARQPTSQQEQPFDDSAQVDEAEIPF